MVHKTFVSEVTYVDVGAVAVLVVDGQNYRDSPSEDTSRGPCAAWMACVGAMPQTDPEDLVDPCQTYYLPLTSVIPVLLPGTSHARLHIPQRSALTRPGKRPDSPILGVSNRHCFRRLCREN